MIQICQTASIESKFVSMSESYHQNLEKMQTASAQTIKIFEEPNKFTRISETASRKFKLSYYASWLPLTLYHYAISQTVSAKSEANFKEPQTKGELEYNSPQRAQSTGIFKIFFEKTLTKRRRTRITRIRRLYTDPRAFAQSVFYRGVSAFISIHPRSTYRTALAEGR